jgi:hypothetical protein
LVWHQGTFCTLVSSLHRIFFSHFWLAGIFSVRNTGVGFNAFFAFVGHQHAKPCKGGNTS